MRQLKSYILLLVVISLFPISLIGCNRTTRTTLEQVLEMVNSATTEIESFHFVWIITNPGDNGDHVQRTEGDVMSPDRMCFVMFVNDIKRDETRCIGNDVYQWRSTSGLWELVEGITAEAQVSSMQSMVVQLESDTIIKALERLDYIEKMPDETVDGVLYEHYRGSVDQFNLDKLKEDIENETDPEHKEALQGTLAELEQMKAEAKMTMVVEYWFGKNDHIVHQIHTTASWATNEEEDYSGTILPEVTRVTATMTVRYSNFNEPVEIEAPILD